MIPICLHLQMSIVAPGATLPDGSFLAACSSSHELKEGPSPSKEEARRFKCGLLERGLAVRSPDMQNPCMEPDVATTPLSALPHPAAS